MPEERIQKVLAAAGVASRRASETLIAAGRVTVDGRVATIGQKVDPDRAVIEVDGSGIGAGAVRVYLALHKPAGVTSTTRDRHAETTVLDLVPTALIPDGTRLYPVGRLDLDSEGLLLLTNDGEWAERILHPRFGVEREYAVGLATPLEPEQQRQLAAGIRLEEGLALLAGPLRPASATETRQLATTLDPSADPRLAWYRATLAQGWKRQLRRMFAAVGAPIARLARVRIGPVRLADLPSGRARALKQPEIRALVGAPPPRPPRHKREGSKGSGARADGVRRGGAKGSGAKGGGGKRDTVRLDGTRRRT
jgi:23S rRNA pseudouridine2605 synthase